MTHGGLGLIQSKRLWLPNDILSPLSIIDDSSVYCLYYPTPNATTHKGCEITHDLMITPIPEAMWSRTGRLEIRLRHEVDTLKPIAAYLKEEGISILNAECNRSAHRYAKWNLTIWFEGDNYLPKRKSNSMKEIHSALLKLASNITTTFKRKKFLFSSKKLFDLQSPVEIYPIASLWYFADILNNPITWRGDLSLKNLLNGHARPFRMKCDDGWLVDNESTERYKALVEKLNAHFGGNFLDAVAIAESDVRNMVIRVAMIPQKQTKTFFHLRVKYERTTQDTSLGLLSSLLGHMKPQQNIWRLQNVTSVNESDIEKGEVLFYYQDHERGALNSEENSLLKDARSNWTTSMIGRPLSGMPHITINDVRLDRIRKEKIRQDIQREKLSQRDFEYDVFFSYAENNKQKAKTIVQKFTDAGLDPCYDDLIVKVGDDIGEQLRNGIIKSNEFCMLVTKDSAKSHWVSTEWGAAWILGRRINVFLHGVSKEEGKDLLPDRLKVKKFFYLSDDKSIQNFIQEYRERNHR